MKEKTSKEEKKLIKDKAIYLIKKNKGKCPCCKKPTKVFSYIPDLRILLVIPPRCKYCFSHCGNEHNKSIKLFKVGEVRD